MGNIASNYVENKGPILEPNEDLVYFSRTIWFKYDQLFAYKIDKKRLKSSGMKLLVKAGRCSLWEVVEFGKFKRDNVITKLNMGYERKNRANVTLVS